MKFEFDSPWSYPKMFRVIQKEFFFLVPNWGYELKWLFIRQRIAPLFCALKCHRTRTHYELNFLISWWKIMLKNFLYQGSADDRTRTVRSKQHLYFNSDQLDVSLTLAWTHTAFFGVSLLEASATESFTPIVISIFVISTKRLPFIGGSSFLKTRPRVNEPQYS